MVDGPRLDQQLCFALYAASNSVVRAYRPLLARIGLTYPQYLVLMVLWEADGVSVQELADRLDQGAHGMAPLLRRLGEAGLISRSVDASDRRVVRVHLTDEGRRLAPLATSAQMDVVCQTGLKPRAYDELRDTLRALADATDAPGQPEAAYATVPNAAEDVVGSLLGDVAVAAYLIDGDGMIIDVSAAGAGILHWPAEQLIGRHAHDTLHHSDERGVPVPAEACPIRTGGRERRVARAERDTFWRQDGAPVPVWWVAVPTVAAETAQVRTLVVFDRLGPTPSSTAGHADQDTRLLVLGQLSELLGINDVHEGLQRVATLGASTLADWCVIDRMDDGLVARAALADRDSPQPDLDRRLRPMPAVSAHSSGSLGRVLRGVDSVAVDLFVDDEPFPGVSTDALDEAQAALFTDLGAAHAFVVPLRARNQVLGAMTWVRKDPARPFTDTDVLLATMFGFRVGMWLDNARLYDQQKRMSEALQRSLLTALPEPDHLHVVARYAPAAEGVEVGGDWYDAHLTHDGQLVVTIGDVTGHDTDAAARMSQLRNMLRFALLDDPQRPEQALTRVDTAMPVLAIKGQASVVTVVVDQTAAEHRASLRNITWTNAGHLPPLLIEPDGKVRLLDTSPDLLLGVRGATPRHAHRVEVEANSTLLLYTDGLVERRDEALDRGLDRLMAAARDAADLPLDILCDHLLDQVAPEQGRADDIALIAVRFHPEDKPRPAEAGPRRVPEALS